MRREHGKDFARLGGWPGVVFVVLFLAAIMSAQLKFVLGELAGWREARSERVETEILNRLSGQA